MRTWGLAAAVALVVLAAIAVRWGSELRQFGGVIVRSLPPIIRALGARLAVAGALAGSALAAALYVHQRTVPTSTGCEFVGYVCKRQPSWENPVAAFIAVGGIAFALGIVAYRNRRSTRPE